MRVQKVMARLVLLMMVFFLAACGSNEKKTSADSKSGETTKSEKAGKGKSDSDKDENNGNIATTVEEIAKEKAGKFAGLAYNKAVVNRALDEKIFQDKDSFQVYNTLVGLLGEGPEYKELIQFAEDFNPNVETALTKTPEEKNLEQNGGTATGAPNISILLDASGSMAAKIGGNTKMDLAKDAINQFLASMPEGSNVSLRVYGHKGSNSDGDKQVSCESTELVYELQPYNETGFKDSLGQFQPTGWTPIAKAISESKNDFGEAGKQGQNIIYVVSDGIETCEGDPVQAAKELHDSNIKAMVNIIGFDVDQNGQKQLKAVADAGGGKFETVHTADDFKRVWERERTRLYNEWSAWSAKNYNEVSAEVSKKINTLYQKKSNFSNLIYDEKSRITNAIYYLRQKEQISPDVREELESLAQQRKRILEDYVKDKYKGLIDEMEAEGRRIKKEIEEKGKEMKDKYNNN
ncbi:VWA domain-containing protein [Bacillus sp. FJAT-29814]|uniref:VWA domain-containing protein n=1 Tax=Bacillus sp. FJAT-29814 TaxID=1729688 RepID=UPI00082EEF16|nr:VWA domain-containing protein [Bacillus sp. FJAT-29814]